MTILKLLLSLLLLFTLGVPYTFNGVSYASAKEKSDISNRQLNILKNFYSQEPSKFTKKTITNKFGNQINVDAGKYPGTNKKWEIRSYISNHELFDSLKINDEIDIRALRNDRYEVCGEVYEEISGGVIMSAEPLVDIYGKPSVIFGTSKGSHTITAGDIVKFDRNNVTIQEVDYKVRKRLVEAEGLYSNISMSSGEVYAHMYNGQKVFISDLSKKPDYRDNKMINVKGISHFDVHFK